MSDTELHTDCEVSKHDEFVANHPFTKRKIYTFTPMQDGQPFVALISGSPMIFRGATAMQANKEAKIFRRDEVEREWDRELAGTNRVKAMKAAREAKKA